MDFDQIVAKYPGERYLAIWASCSTSVEKSAQKAVYLELQTNSTRQVVFVNTSIPDKRIQLIKSKRIFDEMADDSVNIVADNAIKRYAKRHRAA